MVAYKTFQINCTNCSVHRNTSSGSSCNASPLLPKVKKEPKAAKKNKKLAKVSVVNETSKAPAPAAASKTSKHFLISFHPFSFRIPKSTIFLASLSNSANNSKSEATSAKDNKAEQQQQQQQQQQKLQIDQQVSGNIMNKRCCLSVSVVPSDKQNGNKKNAKKNVRFANFYILFNNFFFRILHIYLFVNFRVPMLMKTAAIRPTTTRTLD